MQMSRACRPLGEEWYCPGCGFKGSKGEIAEAAVREQTKKDQEKEG